VSRDPRLYLDDIIEAIDIIADYTAGISEEEFFATRLIQDAVIRRIEIIGEAARQLPRELSRTRATEIERPNLRRFARRVASAI
jgi:uncharacterized protein with HEPN domain